MSDTLSCWNCAAPLDQVLLPVSRHEYCPACAEAVHCCRMCVHYAPDVAEQCREDRTDPPNDKTTANFCDYFSPRSGGPAATGGANRESSARAQLDALFGDDPDPSDR